MLITSDAKVYERITPFIQRVLIVDPQPAAVRLLTDVLRDIARCQIWSAPNPDRGMALAKSVNPQIIFVEQSTAIDGIGLTRSIRQSTFSCRQAPVIMVTSEATAGVILGARDAGAHEFLRKPFTTKDLVRRLEAVTLRQRDWIEAVNYIGPDRRRFNSGDYAGQLKRQSDALVSSDSSKLSQALKILNSALSSITTDPEQVLRAMLAQAQECGRCGTALVLPGLVTASAQLLAYLQDATAQTLDRNVLEGHILALCAFMPADQAGGRSIAA